MIDMHAHWKPAEVADALRARVKEPRILRNADGAEVLKLPRMGEEPLANAFDDVDFHLSRMDRQGVEVSVVAGGFVLLDRGSAVGGGGTVVPTGERPAFGDLSGAPRSVRCVRRAAAGGYGSGGG
jgi:hypothetical protein